MFAFSVRSTSRKQSVSLQRVAHSTEEMVEGQSFVHIPDLRQQWGKFFVLQAKCKHLL